MHLFISAGEPSGDLHGSNLIRHIRELNPNTKIAGFGGDKMATEGSQLLFKLTDLAVMWVGQVLANLRTFFRLADQAEEYFRTQKPDAVILIDYPGFNWHIAKRAKKHGIPVYYFVPPQLWAWAGWRVKKMRRTVNTVLTAMPFEDDWYRRHNVNTHYIGHPYFDEIRQQKLDSQFVSRHQTGEEIVGILPGSRNQEVQKNGPMMLRAAKKIRDAKPAVRFLVAAFNDRQANVIREMAMQQQIDLEIHVGRTPEIIELSKACIAVSGSVSLELFTRAKPTVIVYKIHEMGRFLAREIFMQVPYISLPNLLAREEIFPEFLTSLDRSTKISQKIIGWLDDEFARQKVVNKLTDLREKYALPGAVERAAQFLVKTIGTQENKFRSAA